MKRGIHLIVIRWLTFWFKVKGAVGVAILSVFLILVGMIAQSHLDGQERLALNVSCDRRVANVTTHYQQADVEHLDVVTNVQGLVTQTLVIQRQTLDFLKDRVPQANEVAETVKRIDKKASAAVSGVRQAKDEAARAADLFHNLPTRQPTGDLNRRIKAINRSTDQ